MAFKVASKLSAFWKARKAPSYSRMPTQDVDEPNVFRRTSFESSLHRLDEDRFTSWPNLSVDDTYRPQSNDRHSIKSSGASSTIDILPPSQPPLQGNPSFFHRCKLMCTRFPYRDMSYLVGVSFTIGSAVFVANGFFLLLPLIAPSTNFSTETPYATPASSVIGTLIFLAGSWIAVLEALNLGRGEAIVTITEGIPLESSTESIRGKKMDSEAVAVQVESRDHSTDSSSSSQYQYQVSATATNLQSSIPTAPKSQPSIALLGSPTFIYWPTTPHLISRNILFYASVIQLTGATIFGFATITSLPNVIPSTNTTLLHYLNLLPASLGGLLFLTAALLQMLNSQKGKERWWKGWDWYVSLWNSLGSLGFLLAGLLPWIANGAQWGVIWGTNADFWGSWAFLLGSLVQWWGVMGGYS